MAEAEVEAAEEMTIKKTEEWSLLEPAEVPIEERREMGAMTTMMSTRVTRMGAEI